MDVVKSCLAIEAVEGVGGIDQDDCVSSENSFILFLQKMFPFSFFDFGTCHQFLLIREVFSSEGHSTVATSFLGIRRKISNYSGGEGLNLLGAPLTPGHTMLLSHNSKVL